MLGLPVRHPTYCSYLTLVFARMERDPLNAILAMLSRSGS
jgi:hypothetical protein